MKSGLPVRLGFFLGFSLVLSACSTPSERFGLAPPDSKRGAYPNINAPVANPATPALEPTEREARQAEIARHARSAPSSSAR
ncbi:hypothetical protein [Terrihabitans sp. B22-R8]|uniref:hypothetical protein n=1 Tax=Terrihabitans sp. B22-R8 TaxID=3425128 RepID=UPI00403CAD52